MSGWKGTLTPADLNGLLKLLDVIAEGYGDIGDADNARVWQSFCVVVKYLQQIDARLTKLEEAAKEGKKKA